jgi:hypothetical protein
LIVAVSPYHVTTREPPMMAAALLAERMVTLVPGAVSSKGEAEVAAARAPAFAQMMRSWSWSEPLWRAGVMTGSLEGEDASADVAEASRQLGEDEALASLRPLVRDMLGDDEGLFLSRLARDVLKGGPDPGLSLPMAAGLDRFAARLGALVARAHPTSVAQKAEMTLARFPRSVAAPVLLQADAARVLHARDVLRQELDGLREAVSAVVQQPLDEALGAGLSKAAGVLSRAFAARRDEVMEDCSADDVRAIEGSVVVTIAHLPTDAVYRSAVQALVGLGGAGARRAGREATAPVMELSRGVGAPVVGLFVKAMGQ